MSKENETNCIDRTCCDCVYHCADNCCSAEKVHVGPKNAATSAETVCITFRPRNGCRHCKP